MKPSISAVCFVAAVLFLPLPRMAVAQEPVVPAPEASARTDAAPMPLAIPFTAGKAYRYRATVDIINANVTIKAELTRRETTTAVRANGEIRAELVEEGGKVTINGMENPIPAGKPVSLLMDRYNRLLLFTPEQENSDFIALPIRHLMALSERIAFPRLPVKPGDAWKTEVRNPTGKSRQVVVTSTYEGTELREGVSVWKVRQTFEAATEDGTLEAELIAHVDPASGQIIHATQTLKNVPTAAGIVTWKATLARL